MASIASAFVSIVPSTRGFGRSLTSQASGQVQSSGRSLGKVFGKTFALAGGAIAAAGIGSALKSAITLEAEFSQTMNTIGAVTNVSAERLAKLSKLALQMGKDTSFSASEASNAMLELAKGGMTAATIQAGGLAGTLQLAAAGGTDMETAATIASNAMNAFSLSGKQMKSVAAALAGGANASSASVESLGEALSQVGPGAVNAGLSLQETVATLSAFDAAGIKGSDSGTSLKTMLARLIPQTEKAATAMNKLGLDFVKSDGSFQSITNIAGQLKSQLGGLSEAQRSQALTTIFGSDASRAAAVLMQEGTAGIRGFIKATKDQGAAQRAADARMKGTAGAIEEFKGSLETAQIEFGLLVAPYVQRGLGLLTQGVNNLGPALSRVVRFVKPLAASLQALINDNLKPFKAALAGIGGGAVGALVGGLVGALIPAIGALVGVLASPIVLIGALAGVAVYAYREFEGFRARVNDLAVTLKAAVLPVVLAAAGTFRDVLLPAVTAVAAYVATSLWPALQDIAGVIQTRVVPILSSFGQFLYGTLYPAVIGIASAVARNLKPVFDQLVETFRAKLLPTLDKALATFQKYQPTIQRVIGVVVKVIGKVLEFAAAILGKVLPVAIRLSGFLNGLMVSALIAVVGAIAKVISKIVDFGSKIVGAVKKVAEFQRGVAEKVAKVVTVFTQLPGKLLGPIVALGQRMYEAGAELMRMLGRGITDLAAVPYNALKDVGGKLKDLVPHSPVKEGPLRSFNGGHAGKELMKLLARGITDGAPIVTREATKVAKAMKKLLAKGVDKDFIRGLSDGLIIDWAQVVGLKGKGAEKAFDKMRDRLTKALDKMRSGLQKQIDSVKSTLDSMKSFASSVSSAFKVDLFSGSLTDFFTNGLTNNATLKAVIAGFKKLVKGGFNKGFLSSLIQSGNAGLILELANADAATVQQAQSIYGQQNSLTNQLGTFAAEFNSGKTFKGVEDRLDKLNDKMRDLPKDIGAAVGKSLRNEAVKGKRNQPKGKK